MIKILIIEDEENLAHFVELELKHEGYETYACERSIRTPFLLTSLFFVIPFVVIVTFFVDTFISMCPKVITDYGSLAKIWREGCIIRAQFLQKITDAFDKQPELKNLMLDPYFTEITAKYQAAVREVAA